MTVYHDKFFEYFQFLGEHSSREDHGEQAVHDVQDDSAGRHLTEGHHTGRSEEGRPQHLNVHRGKGDLRERKKL